MGRKSRNGTKDVVTSGEGKKTYTVPIKCIDREEMKVEKGTGVGED